MKLVILLFSLFLSVSVFAQNIGIGASAMYNFQSESYGIGARANINPDNTLSYTPQISYYPGFNKVTEIIIGLGLEYKVLKRKNINYYLLAHAGYNHWFNALESKLKGATIANWNAEVGIGISGKKCLRPFAEYRYNLKFLETHLQLGFIYIINCKGGSGHATCPAYY